MQYVAGYIAYRFPHYGLGTPAKKGDGSWIGAVSVTDGKLVQPKAEFLEKVKIMENMFLCNHGNKDLKPGRGAIELLTESIRKCFDSNQVSLPLEVIRFYVRCRTFFRMRILNRDITQLKSKQNKMKKIVS